MLRLRIILISIILNSSVLGLNSQSNTPIQQLADDHKAYGNNEAALKEYLRAYYYNDQADNLIPSKIAQLFTNRGDYENAIKYYNIQYFGLPYNSSKKDSIRYEKINVYLLAQEYKKAKIEILQINQFKQKDIDRYNFYKGLIYYFNDEFKEGYKYINNIQYLSEGDKGKLQKYQVKLEKNKKVNPKIHQIASGIIPGLGQYIAGDFKNGLNSTLLNGGFVYLFFVVGERLSYADAALSVTPWLMRYFIGGVGNAREAALNKKLRKKSEYVTQTIDVIRQAKERMN